MIEILSIGSGLSLQDTGRPGWRRFGVPTGGAMDPDAMALANRLLGNRPDAPVLEIALQGTRLRVVQSTWLALAGASACASVQSPSARAFSAGDILDFEQKAPSRFAYLAVPGGFAAETWFGSVATDRRNGMGQELGKGTCLRAALPEPLISTKGVARRRPAESPEVRLAHHPAHFEIFPGPQYKAFDEAARQRLVATSWTLSPRSDRTGYRLEGATLPTPESIPSEPVLPGSFQVPGGGEPILTMPDGPTVGGYAKIAVLRAQDLGRFAQCPPRTKLTFSWID